MTASAGRILACETPILRPEDIQGILASLDVECQRYLFIRLNMDGRIERSGATDPDILRGQVPPVVFERLRGMITPALLQWAGQSWSDPVPRGKRCDLVIGFKHRDGTQPLIHWQYGSKSYEPPVETRDFVLGVVEATNPWYEQEKRARRKRARKVTNPLWRLVPCSP